MTPAYQEANLQIGLASGAAIAAGVDFEGVMRLTGYALAALDDRNQAQALLSMQELRDDARAVFMAMCRQRHVDDSVRAAYRFVGLLVAIAQEAIGASIAEAA